MTLPNASFDVATFLAAAGLGTVGTNIFAVAEIPQSDVIPADAIFCMVYGGPIQNDYLGNSPHGLNYPKVQVTVRAAALDVEAGATKARAVWDALHRASLGGTYLSCRCMQSAPNYLGLNDSTQPRWTINLELMASL